MFREILNDARTWLLGATVALATTALDANASSNCLKQSASHCSLLAANNVASGSCGSGAMTEIVITVYHCSGSPAFQTGTILRCAESTAPINFNAINKYHVFFTANGGTWGAVGGGLCSYYDYFAL
jgi:hypothetical protein